MLYICNIKAVTLTQSSKTVVVDGRILFCNIAMAHYEPHLWLSAPNHNVLRGAPTSSSSYARGCEGRMLKAW